MRRESAEVRLDRLRRNLTIGLMLSATLGISGLAAVTTAIEARLVTERFEAELQGQAFRAAALVFFDGDVGAWDVSGVTDDMVMQETDSILVYESTAGEVLLMTEPISQVDGLLSRGLNDVGEEGSIGSVTLDGTTVAAAAAPFFISPEDTPDEVESRLAGAVVVVADGPPRDEDRLTLLVWITAAVLSMLSGIIAWIVSSRFARPLGLQLDREEAFLATAAHELRTPLGRFRAVAESAMLSVRALPESSFRAKVLMDLYRLVQLSTETTKSVEDLLLAGRIDAGVMMTRREPVRLDEIVSDFERSTRELAVFTDGPVEVIGDPTLIHHAIANLIVNAQRHGRPDKGSPLIEATVTRDGADAVVFICDNGPGLGESPESFFGRHHSSRGSAGLGLWIVRSIIEEHHGTVVGYSRDEGAVFEIRLALNS